MMRVKQKLPLIFKFWQNTCIVREGAPLDDAAAIKAAADGCPVDVNLQKFPRRQLTHNALELYSTFDTVIWDSNGTLLNDAQKPLLESRVQTL